MTPGYRKSHEKRSHNISERSYRKFTKKAMEKLEDQLAKQDAELEELSRAIKDMERRSLPKRSVLNTATNVAHIILTPIVDLGVKARTICGW